MPDLPTTGGTYIRDPETGALTRVPDDAPASPEPPTPDPKPSKGGK